MAGANSWSRLLHVFSTWSFERRQEQAWSWQLGSTGRGPPCESSCRPDVDLTSASAPQTPSENYLRCNSCRPTHIVRLYLTISCGIHGSRVCQIHI